MTLNTAVCDDEPDGLKTIDRLLENYHFETGVEFKIKHYQDPDLLISDYSHAGYYDIIFLDVEFSLKKNYRNGIDIAKAIRSIPDPDVRIVFVSNYPVYMQMGFDVQASHYLDKQVSFRKFQSVMDTIISCMQNDTSMIRIKTDRDQWNLIKIQDILYVKSYHGERDKITYYCSSREITELGKSILSVGEDLQKHGFSFANKYYLVNMRHVLQFTHDCLQLSNKEYIEISRHYRKAFMDRFSQNILLL